MVPQRQLPVTKTSVIGSRGLLRHPIEKTKTIPFWSSSNAPWGVSPQILLSQGEVLTWRFCCNAQHKAGPGSQATSCLPLHLLKIPHCRSLPGLVEGNFEGENLRWSGEARRETEITLLRQPKDPFVTQSRLHTPQSHCFSWSCLVSIWCEDREATPMWKRICQTFRSPCRYTLPRQIKSSNSTTFLVLAGL